MDQLDEYEQGENVRKWLRQNGTSLITGIALGLACVFAWNWWQGQGEKHKEQAAMQFQSFTEALEANDSAKITAFSDVLTKQYADTPYAGLSVLRKAQFMQSQGKTDDARKLLISAIATAKDPVLAELLSLRLARLSLISGKNNEATKQLDAIKSKHFSAIAFELRGDIAMASGHRDQARTAYETALTTLDQAAPTRRLVELKLIDAGGKPPAQSET